jgi:hypothetical protein
MELTNSQKGRYVIAVTMTHLYQFVGPHKFEHLFKNYVKEPKYFDYSYNIFPQHELDTSQMQMFYSKEKLISFGWMTGSGFCLGNYVNDPKQIIVKNFNIVPYAKLANVKNKFIYYI